MKPGFNSVLACIKRIVHINKCTSKWIHQLWKINGGNAWQTDVCANYSNIVFPVEDFFPRWEKKTVTVGQRQQLLFGRRIISSRLILTLRSKLLNDGLSIQEFPLTLANGALGALGPKSPEIRQIVRRSTCQNGEWAAVPPDHPGTRPRGCTRLQKVELWLWSGRPFGRRWFHLTATRCGTFIWLNKNVKFVLPETICFIRNDLVCESLNAIHIYIYINIHIF